MPQIWFCLFNKTNRCVWRVLGGPTLHSLEVFEFRSQNRSRDLTIKELPGKVQLGLNRVLDHASTRQKLVVQVNWHELFSLFPMMYRYLRVCITPKWWSFHKGKNLLSNPAIYNFITEQNETAKKEGAEVYMSSNNLSFFSVLEQIKFEKNQLRI